VTRHAKDAATWVQYNVVLCLCHSVFASRDGVTLTKQFEQHGWVATAKSWGRWTAQALVSRAFGRSLMTGVPISMAVQVRGRWGWELLVDLFPSALLLY
jgi:hypothetical protein